MDPRLHLGVELPSLRALESDTASWWETVHVAAASGAGVLWFARTATAPASTTRSCDPIPLAAAAAPSARASQFVGVVDVVPTGRNPSVLARDVTTLDVVTKGRAAVLLRGPSASTEQLAEAVAVCASVLSDESPVFEGRHFHVAGASNLPHPVQPNGVPVFVEMPRGAGRVSSEGDEASMRLLSSVAALVCADDPREVARWRAIVDSGGPGLPSIVCRSAAAGTRSLADGQIARGRRQRAARDAGADGVIVTLPANRDGAAQVVAACLEPWTT